MTPAYLMLALAALAVRASVSSRRYLGLCAIAAGGAGVNYFLMDPVYSFRVSQAGDIAALGLYGAVGIFVVLHRPTGLHHHSLNRNSATLLDAYHFCLLVQLCAEIREASGESVELRNVIACALLRLEQTLDTEGSREIVEDVRLQMEYEDWVAARRCRRGRE